MAKQSESPGGRLRCLGSKAFDLKSTNANAHFPRYVACYYVLLMSARVATCRFASKVFIHGGWTSYASDKEPESSFSHLEKLNFLLTKGPLATFYLGNMLSLAFAVASPVSQTRLFGLVQKRS